jgi:hypothetical protein
MANAILDNRSEKGRIFLIALATIAAMAVTAEIFEQLHLWWIWVWINRQPTLISLGAAILIWGGVMLTFTRGLTVLRFIFSVVWSYGPGALVALVRGLAAAVRGIAAMAVLVLSPLAPVLRAIGPIIEPLYLGFLMVAQPLLAPLAPVFAPVLAGCRKIGSGLRTLWRTTIPSFLVRAVAVRERCAKEWTLWRAYRDEFRGKFPSYREFKRAFEDKSKSSGARQESRPPADAFPHACAVMGLPLDGQFSEAEFKARHRELMRQLHPDIAGPNKRAALVNAASDVIKNRKGWS